MTALEWLEKVYSDACYNNMTHNIQISKDFILNIISQAKEMEKKQQDEFAIGFADWMICKAEKYNSYLCLIKDYKELLEIYKKEL